MNYKPKVYRKQGGNELVVASGGAITLESGGTLTVPSGATFNMAGTLSQTGTQSFDDIVGNDPSLGITGAAPATTSSAGGAIALAGGIGGSVSGAGGDVSLTGGAGTANANGGNVVLAGGALNGTGKTGTVISRGIALRTQGVPAAKTVTGAITAAELVAGLITTTGATGPSVHQLPTGTLIDAELPGIATGDSFDFYIINTGTGASDDATITVNTDVTIVGSPTVGAITDATIIVGSGHFRARRSAANTYVVYRLA